MSLYLYWTMNHVLHDAAHDTVLCAPSQSEFPSIRGRTSSLRNRNAPAKPVNRSKGFCAAKNQHISIRENRRSVQKQTRSVPACRSFDKPGCLLSNGSQSGKWIRGRVSGPAGFLLFCLHFQVKEWLDENLFWIICHEGKSLSTTGYYAAVGMKHIGVGRNMG